MDDLGLEQADHRFKWQHFQPPSHLLGKRAIY